jgi:hypothetical protein
MRNYFDYIYYRATKFYAKWDGNNGINGILMISLIQLLLICDIILPASRIFFSINQISTYSKTLGTIGVIILFALIIYNYLTYNHKYEKIKIRWENETGKESVLRGVLLLVSIIIPWIPLVLLGMRH